MAYKNVPVSKDFTVPVPDNLTPDEEALYIARRIGFVDLEQLEAHLREILELREQGKLIPMEDVLAELSKEDGSNRQAS